MSKGILLITAAMIAAATTLEEAIKLGTDGLAQKDQALLDANGTITDLQNNLNIADTALANEKAAHELTKSKGAELVLDLKEQLVIANANIDSELPIISYKGKKLVVGFTKFQIRGDGKAYTIEDLKKGKKSEELIEKILAIKGQGILSEATAGK